MNRRDTILAMVTLSAACAARNAYAQPGRIYRVASAWTATEATVKKWELVFIEAMREHGYVSGKNLIYEARYANGNPSRLPGLVEELLALKPDVLVGIEQVARVMKNRTATIPIVLSNSSDPVAAGLVQSLARPGQNVTGVSLLYEQLGPKHMELLREILPRLGKVGQLHDTSVPASKAADANARQAARKLGLEYVPYYVASREDVVRAFSEMEKIRPDALVPGAGSGMLFGLRQLIVEAALRLRIAFSSSSAAYADEGALFSYGANLDEGFRLAADYVNKILKGARVGELPVQQPTQFEMVINLRTAKALGVTIPQSVLLRANRTIA